MGRSVSSGHKDASGIVKREICNVVDVILTPGTEATTITVRNGTASDSPVLLGPWKGSANGDTRPFGPWVPGIEFKDGVYVTLVGSGATYEVITSG